MLCGVLVDGIVCGHEKDDHAGTWCLGCLSELTGLHFQKIKRHARHIYAPDELTCADYRRAEAEETVEAGAVTPTSGSRE